MDTTHDQSWVTRDLRPLNPCIEAVHEARKYPDPQTAWDAWTSANELIWTLVRVRANPCQLILCCCELTEPVLVPLLDDIDDEEEEGFYHGAFDAVREWATNPTSEHLKRVDYFYDDVVNWRWGRDYPIADVASRAIEKLVLAVERPHKLLELPEIVKKTVDYLLQDDWPDNILPDIDNDDLTLSRFDQWQCDVVRRFFPITPLIKAYR